MRVVSHLCGLTLLTLLAIATSASAQEVSQAAEFLQRREQLAPDDTAGRLDLGVWCERNQLTWQAAELYRELLEIQPGHTEAYERLVQIADTHMLPDDSAQVEQLKQQFPGTKSHVTSHFVIVYDTDDPFARNRAALLEKAHDVYYTTFRRVDFRPLPLSQRLVCLLFADHNDYLAYAKDNDGAEMGWAAGYYSTRTNRIVFYDERVSPQYEQARKQMDELQKKADQQREQIRSASQQSNYAIVTQVQRELAATQQQLDWYRNRIESTAQVGNATKTVHEATHQLAFNSGLQRRDRPYPFWIAEGIATNFEPDDASKPFGPMQPNLIRKQGVTAMLNGGGLIPLEFHVSLTSPAGLDAAQLGQLYDQTWALFGFLFRYYRDDLREYLESFATMPPVDRSPQQAHDHFVQHFGPIQPLQTQFFNYLKRMP